MEIERLNLSYSACCALRGAGIHNASDIINRNQLYGIRHLDQNSIDEIIEKLSDAGYKLTTISFFDDEDEW